MIKRCVAIAILGTSMGPVAAQAQQLDVPVMEYASADLDTCSLGKVANLKADGDGFLAVRSGPGSKYTKLDEIYNGKKLWLFDDKGEWLGVVYDAPDLSCLPIDADRPVPYEGKKGWVHKKWVEFLAG